jgi:iron complex transport system permease protein
MSETPAQVLRRMRMEPSARAAVAPLNTRAMRLGKRLGKHGLPLSSLTIFLTVVILLSLGQGAVSIAPQQTLAILGDILGVHLPWTFELSQQAVLTEIRAPRVVLGALVGAALAVSGAAMQGLFRNPLADPALIGVSSGAVLGAVLVIVLGDTVLHRVIGSLGIIALPVAAFAGGLAATLLVYRLASSGAGTDVSTLLLAGIAINAVAGAATGLLTYLADDAQLRTLTFWSMGSLGGATWEQVALVAVASGVVILSVPWFAQALNAVLLGEAEAAHIGFPLERIKTALILLVALAVGAAVAFAGMIGFVGLVVPHLLRLWFGPDHRLLLPACALLGAALLLLADLLARTLVIPAELPIGIITALLGGPFFLWLLIRQRTRSGL